MQRPTGWSRRRFLTRSGAIAAGTAGVALVRTPAARAEGAGFDPGPVRHILPTASHDRFLIKVSLHAPIAQPPLLTVDDVPVPGAMTDTAGECFAFDVGGLESDRQYTLRLTDVAGAPLTSPWPLRTFPAPSAAPRRFRLAAITCAGGPEAFLAPMSGYPPVAPQFQPLRIKRRLLARALSFAPDALHANGDHVYWDIRSMPSGLAQGSSPQAGVIGGGYFDRGLPIKGTVNEPILKRDFGPQIADLYGVDWRSTPVYFVRDDHDYTENDEAGPHLRTFPPDPFMVDAARSTQQFYYPELFTDADMPSGFADDRGLSPDFGVLRYGNLFEGWIYNAKGLANNTRDPNQPDYNGATGRDGHPDARMVPEPIERWLIERTRSTDAAHYAHMPSSPILWGAGKFLEWYPDVLGDDGQLHAEMDKPFWPSGWHDQHDRLITAASARADRIPLFISGDLHASALGTISATRGHDLSANPVVSLCCGTPGTGGPGFPSSFRGTLPTPSTTLRAEEIVAPIEENGFSIIDFTPEEVSIAMFRWNHRSDPESAIDDLEPFVVHRIRRR